jgi:glutamate synthase domain-containing protein 2
MAKYKCSVCGYIFDEEKENKSFAELEVCPVCKQSKEKFELLEESDSKETDPDDGMRSIGEMGKKDLIYDRNIARKDDSIRYMAEIHQMALSGEPLETSMGTKMAMPSLDDLLIMGAQLDPMPLLDDEEVDTEVIIGKNAAKPMVLNAPLLVSHMSFGALSKETKIALAEGAALENLATSSGEGGVLKEEKDAAYQYIFEIVPNRYGMTDENLKTSDAIEIKIGQASKPGMGGLLPAEKVTEEIAEKRNKPMNHDIHSPSRFPDISTSGELRAFVEELRRRSGGRPIGIKIAAGNIEADLAFALEASPDFITIDCRGGGTGAGPLFIRESVGLPAVFAVCRARKYLDKVGSEVSLIVTGGFRVSSDFVKALAMGADAVAVATGALIAAGCQQYRICNTGNCPAGLTTQNPKLRKRVSIEVAAKRVSNYLKASVTEMKTFARITGHSRLADLGYEDLATINSEISDHTPIRHV